MQKPATHLERSSFQHPNGGDCFRSQREKVVQGASSMGFECDTMSEYPLSWAGDQDPFGHVALGAYLPILSRCGHRIFESFQGPLGEKYDDLIQARGIGVVTKSVNLNLKSPLAYPDSVGTQKLFTSFHTG